MGAPTNYGSIIQMISGFAPIAFFIISGFLVLTNDFDEDIKLKNTIKRTLICFVILVLVYTLINFLFYSKLDINMFSVFKSKRVWFELVVLNVWPFNIGTCIWYIQALLYTYIFIFILKKLNLLRFDYIFIIIGLILCLLGGEFAGILKFDILGYNCFPGNFLNRGIPYVLLGGLIKKNIYKLAEIDKLYWVVGIFAGLGLVFFEIYLLSYNGVAGYYGHLIGMAVIAISVCMLAFSNARDPNQIEYDLNFTRWHINTIYYTCHPVGVLVAYFISSLEYGSFGQLSQYIGIITFVICLLAAVSVSLTQELFIQRKQRIENKSFDSQD